MKKLENLKDLAIFKKFVCPETSVYPFTHVWRASGFFAATDKRQLIAIPEKYFSKEVLALSAEKENRSLDFIGNTDPGPYSNSSENKYPDIIELCNFSKNMNSVIKKIDLDLDQLFEEKEKAAALTVEEKFRQELQNMDSTVFNPGIINAIIISAKRAGLISKAVGVSKRKNTVDEFDIPNDDDCRIRVNKNFLLRYKAISPKIQIQYDSSAITENIPGKCFCDERLPRRYYSNKLKIVFPVYPDIQCALMVISKL